MSFEYISSGPIFRWFAWYPVNTQDRGWRWLRRVWKQRESVKIDGVHMRAFFYAIDKNFL